MRIRALVVLALLLVLPAAARRLSGPVDLEPTPRCRAGVSKTPQGLVCAEGGEVSGLRAWWLGTPIDLRTADAATLTVVPGIGPKLAQRIIEDRAARGPFSDAADLQRVKGIGPKLAARLAQIVRFE